MSDADWAWAAGIFEGEGCIDSLTNNCRTPRLRVRMTDEDVVRRLHRVTGCGWVGGPHYPANPAHKPFWEWGVGSRRDVALVISMFWPWLGDRRRARITEVLARHRKREFAHTV